MGGFAHLGGATAAADPAGNGDSADIDTLAANLSKGYGLNNCTAQSITGGELAALTCGHSPDPSGPVQAKYLLFADGAQLARSFKTSIGDDVLTGCGDGAQSPTTWHQGSSTENAGQVACGTYQNAAEIIWTNESNNILSYIRGSGTDVNALYQWWRANG